MACDFLNNTLYRMNRSAVYERNWDKCNRGLDEFSSDEELADVILFLDYPVELLKFCAACTIIFMIIGIPGNIITIIALSKYRKIRNATAIFIINLSASDLIYAITIFPITISLFLNKSWETGKLFCRIFPALNYSLTATSVFSIVAITLNRCVMVTYPLHYARIYQTRNLIIMIIAIWFGAYAMLIPTQFEIWGRFSLDPQIGFCTMIPDKNGNSPKDPILTMGFFFPCFFIVVCYSRIIYVVRKSAAKSTSGPANSTKSNIQSDSTSKNQEISTRELTSSGNTDNDENCDIDTESKSGGLKAFKAKLRTTFRRRTRRLSTAPTRRDKKLQNMIIANIISFFLCHIPILIATTTHKEFAVGPYGNMMGYLLLYMSGCINPIIYVVMSKEYRQAYRNVFGFLCKDKIKLRLPSRRKINFAVAQKDNSPV